MNVILALRNTEIKAVYASSESRVKFHAVNKHLGEVARVVFAVILTLKIYFVTKTLDVILTQHGKETKKIAQIEL